MKIVADRNIPMVRDAFVDFGEVVVVSGREISRETVVDASLLLVRSVTPVTAELLEGTRVRFVATATIGIEHIDLAFLEKKGIGFAYAPGSNAASVAEYVVAAILLMARKVQRRKASDMVLGIIGVGNIGSRVCAHAQSLGMRCILNDPPKKRESGDEVFRPLEEVLECSDIVTLHVPLAKDGADPTWRLIDDSFLRRIKPGAILINTSRGGIVDENSLKNHHAKLGGLVLDVWNNEPGIDPELCALADIATPHIAGYSHDGKINGTRMIYKAASAFFNRSAGWDRRELPPEKGRAVDCAGSPDPVYDAVMTAVPILRDSAALKKIGSMMAAGERGNYFDSLRADYPERREFPWYGVVCGKDRASESSLLEKLGFTIVN